MAKDAKKNLLQMHDNSGLGSARGGGMSALSASKSQVASTISKKDAMKNLSEAKELQKRLEDDERMRAKEELNKKGDDAHKVVLKPKYKIDERLNVYKEYDIPPENMFIGLGWDEDNTTNRRHYRQYYPDELENNKELFPQKSPFNAYDIVYGMPKQDNAKPKMFSNRNIRTSCGEEETGEVAKNTQNVVGIFKGIIQVESQEGREAYQAKKKKIIDKLKFQINSLSLKVLKKECPIEIEKLGDPMERQKFETDNRKLGIDHLNISKHLCNLESDEILKRSLLSETRCLIRAYMVSAYNLSSRDNGSDSDPYLKLTCNGKVFSDRDNYQLDNPQPDFFKKFEFEGKFPGSTPLKVEVWDYDMIFGDDLIGTSIVDLEDRFFNMEW